MKMQELRNLAVNELEQKERTLKEELHTLNVQRYTGRVEKPHRFSLIKREIARIQTLLSAVRNNTKKDAENKISNGLNSKKEKKNG